MFYPHRELTEFALQLPPLDVQLEIITVKFLCKCLKSDDLMTYIVHQSEGSLNRTPVHHQLNNLRDFISWKLNSRSRRHIEFTNMEVKQAINYTQEEMDHYQRVVWCKKAKNRCIMKPRTSQLDVQITGAIQNVPITSIGDRKNYIFGHNTSRYADCRVLDFIHGSSIQFQNFCKSIKASSSSTCIYCETEEDSPEHQLFHCYALEDTTRRELLTNIKNPKDFCCEIMFNDTESQLHIHTLLYKRVDFITSINVDTDLSFSD
jgi:hypothetical protein